MGSIYSSGYRKKLFISITPLDTNKSCLMNQQELADLISKLEQKTKGGKWLLIYKQI